MSRALHLTPQTRDRLCEDGNGLSLAIRDETFLRIPQAFYKGDLRQDRVSSKEHGC